MINKTLSEIENLLMSIDINESNFDELDESLLLRINNKLNEKRLKIEEYKKEKERIEFKKKYNEKMNQLERSYKKNMDIIKNMTSEERLKYYDSVFDNMSKEIKKDKTELEKVQKYVLYK